MFHNKTPFCIPNSNEWDFLLLLLGEGHIWDSFMKTLIKRKWHPTPVLLPGKSHGRRSLVGCSPRGHWELDMNQWLHFHFSLSYIGEGNGNPLQCSRLENPRDGGAWWAAVYGVAQSRTRLKRLSSSSSSFKVSFSVCYLLILIPFAHCLLGCNFFLLIDISTV